MRNTFCTKVYPHFQLLNSPWDVCFEPLNKKVYIAMAGQHQIWEHDTSEGVTRAFSGNGYERNLNGSRYRIEKTRFVLFFWNWVSFSWFAFLKLHWRVKFWILMHWTSFHGLAISFFLTVVGLTQFLWLVCRGKLDYRNLKLVYWTCSLHDVTSFALLNFELNSHFQSPLSFAY